MKDIMNEESLMKFNERMAGLLKEEFIGGREFVRLRKYCYRKKEKAILVNKTKSLNIVWKHIPINCLWNTVIINLYGCWVKAALHIQKTVLIISI